MTKWLWLLLTISTAHADPLRIGIIDTGLNTRLGTYKLCPGLSKSFYKDENLDDEKNLPHGMNIMGIIDNQLPVDGDYCFVMYKAFQYEPKYGKTAKALEQALKDNVDIVNLSFGGAEEIPSETAAIKKLLDKGVPVIVAAGNAEDDLPPKSFDMTCSYYPACADDRVVIVGNNKKPGEPSPTSNFSHNKENFMFAIGTKLCGAGVCLTGTSQATANVTGKYVRLMLAKRLYMKKKPKEYTIAESKYDNHEFIYRNKPSQQWVHEQVKTDAWELTPVIEYSAYNDLNLKSQYYLIKNKGLVEENEELKKELERLKTKLNESN